MIRHHPLFGLPKDSTGQFCQAKLIPSGQQNVYQVSGKKARDFRRLGFRKVLEPTFNDSTASVPMSCFFVNSTRAGGMAKKRPETNALKP
jgi:hypothetical protein